MDQDLEELVARASDPRWIPAIYNYCDRRCARCRFNDRCFAFNEEARESNAPDDIVDVVSGSFDRTLRLVRAYAESEAIDLDAITETVTTEEVPLRDTVYEDPLVVAAREYAIESGRLLDALEPQLAIRAKVEVRDAVDSLQWLSTMIAPKICRALTGLVDPLSPAEHQTQNDAHGSAKTARLMIGDSLTAWRVVNEFGRAAPDSPTRALAAMLEHIDQELGERMPRAMEFVRPGFDEPVPGTVRPWSLGVDDGPGDRLSLAENGMLKLRTLSRRLWSFWPRRDAVTMRPKPRGDEVRRHVGGG